MPPPPRRTNRRAAAKRGTLPKPDLTGGPIESQVRKPVDRGAAKDQIAEAFDVPREMLDDTNGVAHWSAHAPLIPDWTALRIAAEERAAAAPIPGSYKVEWWPAHVRFPDLEAPARLAKVYATAEGLYVYTRAPGQADRATGGVPHWFARLDFDKTPRPVTGYAARNAGVALFTEVGQVVLTPLGGCGCSNGVLRAWRPQWAQRNEAWEA